MQTDQIVYDIDHRDDDGEDPWNKQQPLNTIHANELNILPI